MRKYIIPLVLIIPTALVFASLSGVTSPETWDEETVPEARVTRTDLTVSVRAIGELKAERSTTISSSLRGDRGKIVFLVPDGSKVSEGDVLVRLDPTQFEAEVNTLTANVQELESLVEVREQTVQWERVQAERETEVAEYEYRLAEMELEKLTLGDGPLELARLEAETGKAAQELEGAEAYLRDLAELEKEGYTNEAEIMLAGEQVEAKRGHHDTLLRQLESFRDHVLPVRIKQAKATIERMGFERGQIEKAAALQTAKAIADLNEARKRLTHTETLLDKGKGELAATVIKAPIPGMVVLQENFRAGEKRKARIGDTVWANQPLINLPDLSTMLVTVKIREIDLHKVEVGKRATIAVEAYPDMRLTGEVKTIGILAQREANTESTEKYFDVVVSVLKSDERLRPGMTTVVTIISEEKKNAVAIPVQAVFKSGNRTACYVKKPRGYILKDIVVGISNGSFAEVREGLVPGDTVTLSRPPDVLMAGKALDEK